MIYKIGKFGFLRKYYPKITRPTTITMKQPSFERKEFKLAPTADNQAPRTTSEAKTSELVLKPNLSPMIPLRMFWNSESRMNPYVLIVKSCVFVPKKYEKDVWERV